MRKYSETLLKSVLDLSNSKDWSIAVQEWEVEDCIEDEELESSCVCGKENLKYLFTIRNKENGNELFPIGSVCIKKFERSDLSELVDIKESLFKLMHALKDKEYITLDSEYFSRKLLHYLYNQNAFKSNQYNNYEPYNDYEFMLKMFNKKNKDEITINQQRKINGIIRFSIIPYLELTLSGKQLRKSKL